MIYHSNFVGRPTITGILTMFKYMKGRFSPFFTLHEAGGAITMEAILERNYNWGENLWWFGWKKIWHMEPIRQSIIKRALWLQSQCWFRLKVIPRRSTYIRRGITSIITDRHSWLVCSILTLLSSIGTAILSWKFETPCYLAYAAS